MDIKKRRLIIWTVLLAVLVAGIVYALRPQPVPVDMATVERGRLLVTIDKEGKTRIHDVYALDAPLAGQMARIDAQVGDTVEADRTVLTRIRPADPAFLDVRSETEQKAIVEAALAARDLAAAEAEKAAAERDFAASELTRARTLVADGTVSPRTLENAERAYRVADAGLATARAGLNARRHELAQAQARLLSRQEIEARDRAGACTCVAVTSPVSGVILQILHKSEGVVAAGTPLVEIGNPDDLELVVDLLSEDAVLVSAGQKAIIAGWGGPDMEARVRRIEPFGFTKISALGIEEQRVNVVLDLVDPPTGWRRLGHGYRVDVRVVLYDADTLKLPLGAVFRNGQGRWAVFVAEGSVARLQPVELGARNNLEVEVKSGVEAGTQVVLYPGDRIADGTALAAR